MRYIIAFACVAALAGGALAQSRGGVPAPMPRQIPSQLPTVPFQPFFPPVPAAFGTPAPLVIFPNFAAYNASAFFWAGPDNSNYGAVYGQPPPALAPVFVELPPPPPDNRARITLQLPRASAEVWVGNQKLEETGLTRNFVSTELNPAKSYSYNILVRWYENGVEKRNSQRVPVLANENPVVTILGPNVKVK